MIENRSAPPGDIVPALVYDDLAKAIAWLCDVFGFTERLRASAPDGAITHAQLALGQGGIFLTPSRTGQGFASPDTGALRPPRPNEVSQILHVRIPDANRHHEHAAKRGARILQPPATYPYGERQYTAEDFAGYRWTFSQSVADVNPGDWGAQVGEIKSRVKLLPRPRLCYLEIPAINLRQSVAFYEKIFGWNIRRRDSDRPSFDDATGNVSGAWVTGRAISREAGLLPYIWVDNIDAILAEAAAHGGEVVHSRRLDSPGGEWIATLRDPAGNLIGLYQEGG
ncbi:MAG TPA: VOC family protein [Candidatus Acidoferrales bacterium]|nr:VOC family protein [Candidatus Acidoferrales bacterium]